MTKEIKLVGKIIGVNLGDDGEFTSFVGVQKGEITPQGVFIAIKGVHLVIGTPSLIIVRAEEAPSTPEA